MVRFGIAGTGRISDWVLKGALQDPRFKAVAVCSRSAGHAREFIDCVEAGLIESPVNTHEISLVNREVMDEILTVGSPKQP